MASVLVARGADGVEIRHMADDLERELAILRRLSPDEKLAVMNGLIRQAFDLKMAWVRANEPQLGEDEVLAKVRELVVGGRS